MDSIIKYPKLIICLVMSAIIHFGIIGFLYLNSGNQQVQVVQQLPTPAQPIKANLVDKDLIQKAVSRQQQQQKARKMALLAEEQKLKKIRASSKKAEKSLVAMQDQKKQLESLSKELESKNKELAKEKQQAEKAQKELIAEQKKLQQKYAETKAETLLIERKHKEFKENLARNSLLEKQFNFYVSKIEKQIFDNRSLSSVFSDDLMCKIRIQLLPDGSISSAKIVQSSGNSAYDIMSEKAVYKASPFVMPDDPDLLQRLRDFVVGFKMMVQQFLKVILLFSLSTVGAKPFYIEITGGENQGIPIVVAPFFDAPKISGNGLEDIADIVRNDLQNTGQFRPVPMSELRYKPKYMEPVDYKYWRSKAIENLIVGQVIPRTDNTNFDVNFQLIDIYRYNAPPMLNVTYKNKSTDEFRELAHHISDKIFEKLTGVRGFFSTRIAYITYERLLDRTLYTLTVADADGHNDTALLTSEHPIMSPSWSADGKKLAFVAFDKKRTTIKVVDLSTGRISNITSFLV